MGRGSGDGGARGRHGARAAAPGPRAAAACDVPPVARGDARGAAVVGRRAGRRGAVPRPVWGVRERGARRRVRAVSVRPAARRRGGGAAVCGPRVLPSVVAGGGGAWKAVFFGGWWGQGLGDSVLDLQEGVCVLCGFLFVCASPPPEALQRACILVPSLSPPPMTPSPPEALQRGCTLVRSLPPPSPPPEVLRRAGSPPPSATRPIGLEGYATPLTPP